MGRANGIQEKVLLKCNRGELRRRWGIVIKNCQWIIVQLLQNGQKEIKFSIMDIVRQLKEMRLRLVENEKQYLYLYQFVNLLLNENN